MDVAKGSKQSPKLAQQEYISPVDGVLGDEKRAIGMHPVFRVGSCSP
jgi:hypothetical protein